jgi:hypothetical protein
MDSGHGLAHAQATQTSASAAQPSTDLPGSHVNSYSGQTSLPANMTTQAPISDLKAQFMQYNMQSLDGSPSSQLQGGWRLQHPSTFREHLPVVPGAGGSSTV